jgi:proteasome assembly chaperone (PAC2) family protein
VEHLRWEHDPEVRTPVLVAAFAGWNDAGDAATGAIRHLLRTFGGTRFASLDPEEFYDFQQTRPNVRLQNGTTREIVWPGNEFFSISTPGTDVVLLLGNEPQLKWRTFCEHVLDVATRVNSRLVVTLGALLADVPHRGEVQIIGTASDPGVIRRYELQRSRYEGPTGIVGVLHDACNQVGLQSVSLWAACPAYAPGTPSPKATLALVAKAADVLGTPVPAGELVDMAIAYEEEVDAAISADDDLASYVHRLELLGTDDEDDDEDDEDDEDEVGAAAEAGEQDAEPGGGAGQRSPSGLHEGADPARLVEEVERFLRDQGRDP